VNLSDEDVKRFWSSVDVSAECWIWTAGRRGDQGYGAMWVGGTRLYAHRLSYQIEHGEIPAGRVIDHICRNRLCVRPTHLRAVTQKQNSENLAHTRNYSRSGVRGVQWHKGAQKWMAQLTHNYHKTYLGLFETVAAAEAAVTAARNEYFTHNDADRHVG
jgi:hypothetical protein